MQRLLKPHVKPGMRFLEVGCAPGKFLAWVARVLQAEVSGLDPSQKGLGFARELFQTLGLDGDLRCESLLETTFKEASFDVVFSAGLVEHFEDPAPIINKHIMLVKPAGTALIVIPNYGGIYGYLQSRFDPHNLSIHNLRLMRPAALNALTPTDVATSQVYLSGRLSPWLINFEKRWPQSLARLTTYLLNALALIQPTDLSTVCPMLVLEIQRKYNTTPAHS